MATDEVRFPQVLFLSGGQGARGGLAAEGRRLSDAGRLAGQARAGRRPSRRRPAGDARGSAAGSQGTRRDARVQECLNCHRLEIDYSRFERLLELPGPLGVGRDRRDLPGRDVVDTDPDGGASVTQCQPPGGRRRSGIPGHPARAAAEEHGPVPLPVPAAVGRPADLAGRRRGRPRQRGQDVPGRGPARPAGRAARRPTTSTPSARGPSIKKMARSATGIELLVQGVERVGLVRLEQTEPYLKARVRPLPLPDDRGRRSRPSAAPCST